MNLIRQWMNRNEEAADEARKLVKSKDLAEHDDCLRDLEASRLKMRRSWCPQAGSWCKETQCVHFDKGSLQSMNMDSGRTWRKVHPAGCKLWCKSDK